MATSYVVIIYWFSSVYVKVTSLENPMVLQENNPLRIQFTIRLTSLLDLVSKCGLDLSGWQFSICYCYADEGGGGDGDDVSINLGGREKQLYDALNQHSVTAEEEEEAHITH